MKEVEDISPLDEEGAALRLTRAGSNSTWPKSGFIVTSSVRLPARPYLTFILKVSFRSNHGHGVVAFD